MSSADGHQSDLLAGVYAIPGVLSVRVMQNMSANLGFAVAMWLGLVKWLVQHVLLQHRASFHLRSRLLVAAQNLLDLKSTFIVI